MLISDNCSAMRAAWFWVKQRYPTLICLGCLAHILNLLAGDVLEVEGFKDPVGYARAFISFVNRLKWNAKFEGCAAATCRLPLPAETRAWTSISRVLGAFTPNRPRILSFCTTYAGEFSDHHRAIDGRALPIPGRGARPNDISEKQLALEMLKPDLLKVVEDVVRVLAVVMDGVKATETLMPRLPAAYDIMADIFCRWQAIRDGERCAGGPLQMRYDAGLWVEILNHLQKRWRFFYHPVAILANVVDPRRRGQRMRKPEYAWMAEAERALDEMCELMGEDWEIVQPLFHDYVNGRDFFEPDDVSTKNLDGIDLWDPELTTGVPAKYDPLKRVLAPLMRASCASVAIEGIFSSESRFERDTLRSSLLPEKRAKLIVCRQAARMYRSEDIVARERSSPNPAGTLSRGFGLPVPPLPGAWKSSEEASRTRPKPAGKILRTEFNAAEAAEYLQKKKRKSFCGRGVDRGVESYYEGTCTKFQRYTDEKKPCLLAVCCVTSVTIRSDTCLRSRCIGAG